MRTQTAEPLRFTATPQQGQVSALLLRPPDAVAVLVIAHGAGTDMRHSSLETLSEALFEQRVATFRYNFPYMEGGRGRISPKPVLTATVRAAVAAAVEAAPGLPLFAGGRSMGGRMTSLAASQEPLPGVKGLIFFAFPLHPAGKPGTERAEHLFQVNIPMLFLQGPRDALASPELLAPIIKRLGRRATLHMVAGADHGFKVLKSAGRTEAEVLRELAETTAGWISAYF
ncbi:MAG TPA: alpha/beta family hydrolase [Anaerolineales bacterium]|nr:alpha/beta family hydrolase [Anaerolineales bacterium]